MITKDIRRKSEYIVAVISEFSKAHQQTLQQTYSYLKKYQAIRFLEDFYDIEHTLSFANVVSDLTEFCCHRGGTLK